MRDARRRINKSRSQWEKAGAIKLSECYTKGLIMELNFKLFCYQIGDVPANEYILWVDDIVITSIKKPGLKERVKAIIQRIIGNICGK